MTLKKLFFLGLLITTLSVSAKQFILIDYDVSSGTEFLVDKDSIRKIDKSVVVEMQFNMSNPQMTFFTQRLFNCKDRESSILKISLNDGPLEPPRGGSVAGYVPNDGKSFSKIFNYVCDLIR
jgi:hypothetical protein